MTARTIPFWENYVSQNLQEIAKSTSVYQVEITKAKNLGITEALFVAGKMTLGQAEIHTANICLTAQNRISELKAQGVMI